MRGGMAPALRMPALGSSIMSLPATLRLDRACIARDMFRDSGSQYSKVFSFACTGTRCSLTSSMHCTDNITVSFQGMRYPDMFLQSLTRPLKGAAGDTLTMAAERAGMRARLPRTAASSARVHQWVDRLPSSFTSQGTQPSFPASHIITAQLWSSATRYIGKAALPFRVPICARIAPLSRVIRQEKLFTWPQELWQGCAAGVVCQHAQHLGNAVPQLGEESQVLPSHSICTVQAAPSLSASHIHVTRESKRIPND